MKNSFFVMARQVYTHECAIGSRRGNYISGLEVEPRCRRQGIGKSLLAQMEIDIKNEGYRNAYVLAVNRCGSMASYYHQFGYQPVSPWWAFWESKNFLVKSL